MEDLVSRAKEFAKLVHGGKNLCHQKEMELLLKELGITQDEILLASVWLINTLRDTEVTYSTLKTQFGKEVADIIYGIPRDNEFDIFGDDERSILLLLLYKVVTTESFIDNNSKEYELRKKRFPEFRKFLYDEKSITYPIIYLWYYLENLYRSEEKRLSVEEVESIAKDIYSTNLDEREASYYDEVYQIVEERLYDQ